MASERIFVFCYDVSRDRVRDRVASTLEEAAVRVQYSVFEARLGRAEGQELARRTAAHLEPGDSLRVYALTDEGRRESLAFGPPPLPEAEDFWLL